MGPDREDGAGDLRDRAGGHPPAASEPAGTPAAAAGAAAGPAATAGAAGTQRLLLALAGAVVILLVTVAYLLGRGGAPGPDTAGTAAATVAGATGSPTGTAGASVIGGVDGAGAGGPGVDRPGVDGPGLDGAGDADLAGGGVSVPVQPERFTGYVATSSGGTVFVRAAPGLQALQLTRLPHGTAVSVTGSVIAQSGVWYRVALVDGLGWIKGDFVSRTPPPVLPVPAARAAGGMIPRDFIGVAVTRTGDSVNVRASPGMASRVVGSVPYGHQVWVVGEQDGWYLVEYAGGRGWRRGWTSARYIRR